VITVYTFKNSAAVIICPHCGQKETIAIACLERKSNLLELTCACKSTYRVTLEFRENFRKEISIPGRYNTSEENPPQKSGSLLLKNISACGVGLIFPDSHVFKEGETFSLEFKLDGNETTIIKTVAVRFVHDEYCGCEFVEKQLYRSEIKLFLDQ
jgi:c-di-GMP-binding flagellar brake protein YcgR